MSNYLPNTSYYYDSSSAKGMDTFLKYIYTIAKSNPDLLITSRIIYNELKFDNLKKIELDNYSQGISTEHLFEKWKERFAGRKNIKVYREMSNSPYFLQFVNELEQDSGEYIKLYIPLDYEHLYDGVNQIFDFLDREEIEHVSKVSKQMRVDNVIIRLNAEDFDNANRIIEFISRNSKIKNGLNRTNPFVPTRKGIGIISDHGNSYNYDLSEYISNYINESLKLNKEDVSVEEFRDYLKTCCYDMSVLDTFELAFNGHSRINTDNVVLNDEQKYMLFLDALKYTYYKHGMQQAKKAIVHVMEENDYGYFSRGVDLRENLRKYVNGEEMRDMITGRLKLFMDPEAVSISDDGIASQFCDIIFSDELVLLFDEICNATLSKYGVVHLEYAINKFIMTGSTGSFSRYGENGGHINYRDCLKRFDNKTLLSLIAKSLRIKGIDADSFKINDLVDLYVTNLNQSRYDNPENEENELKI